MDETKIPVVRRISALVLALILGFSAVTGTISSGIQVINSQTAYASSSNGEGNSEAFEDWLAFAASFLGAQYANADHDATNGYGASSVAFTENGTYTLSSYDKAYYNGFHCVGYLWYVFASLGFSTAGFSFNNPVPVSTQTYVPSSSSSTYTLSYNGQTANGYVSKFHSAGYTSTGLEYWELSDGSTIPVGSIIVTENYNEETGVYEGVHTFVYIGEFDNKAAVVSYLKSLGVDSSLLTTSSVQSYGGNIFCGSGRYAEGSSTHWMIECGGHAVDRVAISNCGAGISSGSKASSYYSVISFNWNDLDDDTGSLKITKSSEDGVISGVQFQVTGITEDVNDTYSKIVTTGSDGTVQIDELVWGYYTVTEVNTKSYYVKPESQTVLVDPAANTAEVPVEVTVTNKLARGDLKVTKTSEDGQVSGLKFRLYGTSTSGTSVDITATTNSSGVATFTDILVGTYTLTEVDTPEYYVTPDSQKVTITDNSTSSATYASAKVTNYRKWFKVTVTKVDADTGGAAQGDATLAGAVYGIYQDGALVSTYTTDANGQFTTNYYLCGDGWTIKEITPSEGYLLDETEYAVGAENKLYTIRYNTAPAITSDEDVIYGQIAIIKHTDLGDTGIDTPEDGAVFQVYLKSAGSYDNAKSTERDILTTDENGYAITKDLPYGTYTVHQVSGWDGRYLVDDFDVYISQDGKVYYYILNNSYYEGYIKIVKTDSETGETIPYAGAGFQLYDTNGDLITMTYTYPTVTTIDTFYTNDEGYLITPETLEYGLGYSIIEVQAPYGYVLDSAPVYFDVTDENATDELYYDISVVMVNYANAPQKGIITVYKTGEVFATVQQSDDFYQAVYEEQGLEGAVYEITAAEDIYTGDGTLRYSEGEVVDTITTGEDGTATSKELYLGKYEITEIEAPYGMTLNNEAQTVKLTYAGQLVSVTETSTSFVNDRQKVSISLDKVLETDSAYGIGTNGEITSVAFALYAAEELTATDGSTIPTDGLLEIAYCDENGAITFNSDLPLGSYYVEEYATDEHYVMSNEKYAFTFDYAGQDVELVTIALNDGAAIENDIIRGTITGLKLDEDNNFVEGALFGIFSIGTTEFTEDTAIAVSASDADGVFGFEDVPYGEWIIREISAPDCYVVSDTLHYVTISDVEQAIEITAVNEFVTGTIELTKVDAEYPDNKLTGAVFEVYQDTDNDGEYVSCSDLSVGTMTEVEKGVYQMDDLRYGGYFVREITAPEGFVLDENVYYVFVEEDGETYLIENEAGTGCFINQPQRGALKIIKTSSDGKVEGFSFQVSGSDYIETFTTDENGEILIEGLRIGEYTVSEVADEASAGYVLPEAQTVIVVADEIVTVDMYNTLAPKTGMDSSGLMLAFAGAVLSGAGFVTCGSVYFSNFKTKRRRVKASTK